MSAPGVDDAAHRPACPHCKGAVIRVPRRFVDLLISIFVPVRRFRCCAMRCGWEGNLRNSRYFLSENGDGESYERRFYVLDASQMGPVTPREKPPR